MEQVPHEEEDRESKTTHFVSYVGPDSIFLLIPCLIPAQAPQHMEPAIYQMLWGHADFWGKSIPTKRTARAKALM